MSELNKINEVTKFVLRVIFLNKDAEKEQLCSESFLKLLHINSSLNYFGAEMTNYQSLDLTSTTHGEPVAYYPL